MAGAHRIDARFNTEKCRAGNADPGNKFRPSEAKAIPDIQAASITLSRQTNPH